MRQATRCVSNLAGDPLADALHLQNGASWTRVVQWREQDRVRAATAVSQFERGTDEVLTLAGEAIPCRVWQENVTVSAEQIQKLPYASMYARIDNGARIFVVLGYLEAGQQKWVTQDKAMLVMQHGRLVKTLGLRDNLQATTR
ncbi:hypothetical protein CRX72_06095 [Pantoea sp. BRM17]|nr:hypothetical protein CRX72_06095 [Pantoea sp. BRM17]